MTLSLWEAEWQECSWNQASKSELSIFFYAQLPFFLHRQLSGRCRQLGDWQLSGRQMLSDTAGEGTWCRGESRKVLGDLIRSSAAATHAAGLFVRCAV